MYLSVKECLYNVFLSVYKCSFVYIVKDHFSSTHRDGECLCK